LNERGQTGGKGGQLGGGGKISFRRSMPLALKKEGRPPGLKKGGGSPSYAQRESWGEGGGGSWIRPQKSWFLAA